MTSVINFKTVKKHWNRDTCQWDDEQYVYVGRFNVTYKLPQSPWANPFHMGGKMQREQVIELYRRYITDRIEAGELDLEELRGKTLCCWCAPLPCHADVILELIKERFGED